MRLHLIKNHPYLSAAALALLFWGLILGATGAVTSGYKLVDDHEILRMVADLEAPGADFTTVAKQWLAADFGIRFRPLYVVHRLSECRVFGADFTLWALYRAILAIATSVLLFAFVRRIGFSWAEAVLFAWLSLAGQQAAVWWRLGPQETLGAFLAAGAMLLVAMSACSEHKRWWHTPAALACIIAMSLCKESFVLFVPALAVLRVWLTRQSRPELSWRQAARRNAAFTASLLLVSLVEVIVIVACVGTNTIGYAGVDAMTLKKMLFTAANFLRKTDFWLILGGALFLLGANLRARRRLDRQCFTFLKHFIGPLVFSAAILAPQILLYAKSGISERYRLPAIFGLTILTISLYRYFVRNHPRVRWLFLLAILVYAAAQSGKACGDALRFAAEGRLTAGYIGRIKAATDEQSPILLVGDPARNYEVTFALKTYLELALRRRNLYVLPVLAPPYSPYLQSLIAEDRFSAWFAGRVLNAGDSPPQFPCVAILIGAEEPLLRQRPEWLHLDGHDRVFFTARHGNYVVYSRRGGGGGR